MTTTRGCRRCGRCAGAIARAAIATDGGRGAAPRERLAALLEAELAGRGGVTLVERGVIERVLREQQLSEAFGAAAGTAPRAALGRVLRADLLVILSPGPPVATPAAGKRPNAAAAPHARLVVCETRRGRRLANAAVPLTDDPEAHARTAAGLVDAAPAKRRLGFARSSRSRPSPASA